MRLALKVTVVVLAVAAAGEGALLGFLAARSRWRQEIALSPVVRGEVVAVRMGCFGCHGPGGARPIHDPGAKDGEVPGWVGGTWMMWNDRESDIRGWIADGHPKDREPERGALIRMPAYAKRLSREELDDLTAYVLAASAYGWPSDPKVANGREAGFKFGCFGCHGPEGRGLVWNPGSLKGYIPPWDGDDFPDLVRGREEFRQWVRNGITARFRANPAARYFVESEQIQMPAFGDRVSDADLDALWAYVGWVRANPRSPVRD